MEVDSKIIEKLKKLLALSASDNENEAELAMNKAEEIMRKHNLSVQDVAMDGSGANIESAVVYGQTKSVQKWERSLGNSIARAFDGQAVLARARNGHNWQFTFIAGKTDLVIIVDLFERLRRTIRRMSAEYVAANRSPYISPRTQHNSYRIGVVTTVRDRLEQIRHNSRPDDFRNPCGLTGKELLVVKDKAVRQHMEEMFPNLKFEKTRFSSVDSNAYHRGLADGQNVCLHRSVNGSRKPRLVR